MSNLFEEFSENHPEYIDLEGLETDGQLRLRECFESLKERNKLEIICFDPDDSEAFKVIKCRTIEKEIEAAEPQLTDVFMAQMLRAVKLEAPQDQTHSNYIYRHIFSKSRYVTLFSATREDSSIVPVYFETNEDGTPELIVLLSHVKMEETLMHYRDLDEYRSRLITKLDIGEKMLRTFSVEELRDFDTSFDRIQSL